MKLFLHLDRTCELQLGNFGPFVVGVLTNFSRTIYSHAGILKLCSCSMSIDQCSNIELLRRENLFTWFPCSSIDKERTTRRNLLSSPLSAASIMTKKNVKSHEELKHDCSNGLKIKSHSSWYVNGRIKESFKGFLWSRDISLLLLSLCWYILCIFLCAVVFSSWMRVICLRLVETYEISDRKIGSFSLCHKTRDT